MTRGLSRRGFMGVGGVTAALPLIAANTTEAAAPMTTAPGALAPVTLTVNGQDHAVALDPRTTLLDALRETLALTGTKKGCDHGQCGACTVHVNGRRVLSCLNFAVMH